MTSPLAPITSIKVKLGLLVAASVVVAAVVGVLGADSGVPSLLAVPVTVALALGVTQLLAVGMTSPLREMTEATRRMARGDYRGRVRADSSDEVGELARAFNQMAAELATVDREQRDLVATVSHELRTPLAALTAVLENLADGVVPADGPHLDLAVGQARRLSELVGDLLALSRVDAGVASLSVGPVALGGLLDEVVADLVPTGRGVRFAVEVDESLTPYADPARLRQLLTNLLDNAVRHGPEQGTVRVRAGVSGDRWWLEVADDGPGVAAADRERAFERFGTLAANGVSTATGGTGLGLAIARWVAQLHGGTVRFIDAPGATGAVVRLDLPARPGPTGPTDSSATSQELAMSEPASPPTAPAEPITTVVAPPVLEPLFGRRWPDAPGGSLRVIGAAAAVGTLGAVVLPFRPFGLAYVLVLLAAGATVWAGARHRRDPFTTTCAVLAALTTLPVMLLDAPWIVCLCVFAGGGLMVAGVTRGRQVPEFFLAGLAWPVAGLRGLPWLSRGLSSLAGRGNAPAVVRTVLWSVLAVLVFGVLFVSADAIVAHWVDALLPDLTLDTFVLRVFLTVAIGGATLAAAYLALNPPRLEVLPGTPRLLRNRFEWLAPVLLVDAVYLVFVVAQVTVLFGGHDYVRRTTGLTYADYVHQGFGQLTVATLLTLLVVWAASRRAGDGPADRGWLRGSLGLLCALTLVVVASALSRMHLYQVAYGFTRMRLLVDVFEGWLGVVVLAVAVAGLVRWGTWLPRFALITGVLGLLGLAAVNPDAWIARHNLERYAETGKVDWTYLQGLSADAVPVIAGDSETARRCGIPVGWTSDGDWLAWNLGRSRADAALASHPSAASSTAYECPGQAVAVGVSAPRALKPPPPQP